MQRELETMRKKLPRIEHWAQQFDAIEKVISPEQCSAAIEALRDLLVSLNALRDATERSVWLVVPLFYAIDQSNKALVQLVAYQSVCLNMNRKRLLQRQTIARSLDQLIQAAQKLLTVAVQQPEVRLSMAERRQRAGFSVVSNAEETHQ